MGDTNGLGNTSTWPVELTGRLLDLEVDLRCVASFDGFFVELSGGWTDLLGYSCDELLSRPFLEYVSPDDVASTTAELDALRAGRSTVRFRNRWVARSGAVAWLAWTAVADLESGRYYAVARDVTAEHDAEVTLRESEERYSSLIQSSHDMIQSIAPDGTFEFVNRAWHNLLGYTEDDLKTLNLFDIIDPADHEHCMVAFGQVMNGLSLDYVEVTFLTKDGRRIPMEGNATGRYRDGAYVASHSFFRDVSERRKAEELAARYQRQLEDEVAERTTALVQSEKLATLGRLSAGMAHELNNPAAAAQRGASRLREAIEAMCSSLVGLGSAGLSAAQVDALTTLINQSAHQASQPDTLDPLSRSDREQDLETWLVGRGIERPWTIAGPLVTLGFGHPQLDIIAEVFDATTLPVVLRVVGQSHQAFAHLEQVSHGTTRISEIVTALKAYSYMDRAPVQHADIHEGLDNTLVMLQGKLKQGVEVERAYAVGLPTVEAPGSELNQVWTNLIDNAVDAMDGQGHLIIRTSLEGDAVVVELTDDGPGIAADHVDKVFEPFFTTKLPGQGTGLGLNIVYNIVRGFGGQISVASRPGHTCFQLRIPIESAAASGASTT